MRTRHQPIYFFASRDVEETVSVEDQNIVLKELTKSLEDKARGIIEPGHGYEFKPVEAYYPASQAEPRGIILSMVQQGLQKTFLLVNLPNVAGVIVARGTKQIGRREYPIETASLQKLVKEEYAIQHHSGLYVVDTPSCVVAACAYPI